MDKYSFLNAAHTSFFAELYEKYQTSPDSIEPSWRAFFQGFDFGTGSSLEDLGVEMGPNGPAALANGAGQEMPEDLLKEFQVDQVISGYRSREVGRAACREGGAFEVAEETGQRGVRSEE